MEDDELGQPEPDSDERRLNIQMPAELVGGTYANFANVSFSPYEFTLTFARIEHEVEEGDVPGAVVARVNASARFIPELIAALQDSWSKYVTREGIRNLPEAPGHSDDRRLGRELTLSLVPSYAVLCAAQAATVAAPARQARARGRSWVWVAVPAALLGAGVLIINVVPQGPHWLARLATFGTPVLAAAGGFFRGSSRWWLWPPVAVGLWFVAWLASGLVQDAAGVALIALACLAAASAAALVAPAWSIRVGLVGSRGARRRARLGNTERAGRDDHARATSPPPRRRHAAAEPAAGDLRLRAHGLARPARSRAARRRRGRATQARAAAVDRHRCRPLGLLVFTHTTNEVAATVPVLAGLAFAAVDARRSRLRHPLEPARAGGGPRGDRRGGA